MGGFGGSYTRRFTHKAVHTQGGAHTRRSVATAGVGVLLIGLSRPPMVSARFRSSGPAGVIAATATGDLQRGVEHHRLGG